MKRVLSILILGAALFSCSQRGPLGGQNKVNKEQQDTTKNNEGENNGNTDGPNTPPQDEDEYIC